MGGAQSPGTKDAKGLIGPDMPFVVCFAIPESMPRKPAPIQTNN